MGNKSRKAASQAATIWTLKTKLVSGIYAQGPWGATIEIDSSATLEDLHRAIQNAVQFDHDHLYLFFMAFQKGDVGCIVLSKVGNFAISGSGAFSDPRAMGAPRTFSRWSRAKRVKRISPITASCF